MAEKHLGLPFDIHGGGADLKFPHHENEIAQSCCAYGKNDLDAFAKTWVHNGFLTVEGEKMSKSLGNFTTVHDLIEKGVKGEVIRFALLSGHYRQPLDWSEKLIQQTEKQLDGFYRQLKAAGDGDDELDSEFIDALADDLNTPLAVARLHALAPGSSKNQLLQMGKLVGILQQDPDIWLGYKSDEDTGWIDDLLVERTEAKKAKNFARADEIRTELSAKGIAIEDTAQGPVWRKL